MSPGTAVPGFPPGIVTGTIHSGDTAAAQAQADALTAYNTLAGEPPTSDLSGQDLGGRTLTPGVYHFASAAVLSGPLSLDTTSDPTGTFIFQIGTTLTTSASSAVILTGTTADPNIFWQVGSIATLGTNSVFNGSILANTSIILDTGAIIPDGRALALNDGSVTLDTNQIAFSTGTTNYWSGNASALWSGANWSTNPSGASSSTLVSGADVVFSVTGVPAVNQDTVLDVDATIASLTVNDPVAVTITGSQTLSITGTGITINSGAGLTTINSNLQLSGSPEITVNNAVGLVINGIVGGSIGLTKEGTGLLTLTGINTYTGGTIVSGGVLSVVDDAVLGNTNGGITLQGGELLTTGLNFISTRAVTLNPIGPANTLAAAAATTATYTGIISGDGALTVGDGTNTGTVVLGSGTNTYVGGTTVTGGAALSVDKDTELGDSKGAITLDGGKLVITRDGFNTARTVNLGSGTNTLAAPDAVSRTATLAGLVTGSGGLTVGDANSATLTVILSNTGNDYSGGTTVTGGAILEIDADTELGNLNGGVTLAGGTLQTVTDGFVSARPIALLASGAKASTLASGFDATATYNGPVTGSGGLTIGGGVVVLNGVNTYTGGTTIQDATLSVANDANLGDQSGGLTLSGGELVASADGFSSARAILIRGGELGNVLAAATLDTATYTGAISGNSPLQIGDKAHEGIVVLAGHNTYVGNTTVTGAATLSIATDANLGDPGNGITLQNGELLTTADNFSTHRAIGLKTAGGNDTLAAASGTTATYSGIISRVGGILSIGDGAHNGTIVLSGNNTYDGGTNIFSGTLVAAGNNALGTTGPAKLFGSTLIIREGVTLPNPVELVAGGTLVNFGTLNNSVTDGESAPKIVMNSGTINGSVTLGGEGDIVQLFTGSKITGTVDLGPAKDAQLILDGAGADTLSLAVTGTVANNGSLIKQGSGTWTISRALSAPAGTDILQGTLIVEAVLTTAQVNITPGATLQLNSGGSVGNLVDDGSLIFASSGTVNFTSVISGPGNVVQNGTGTTILSGKNTYTGGTLVELGTLLVNDAQALGIGNVTVTGGVLAADPEPINVVGNYTQSAGGTLQLNIAGRAAGQFDVLNVTGNAALNGTLRLINFKNQYQPQSGDQLKLVTTGGAVTGRFSELQNPFALAVGFNTIDLVYARQSVTLEFLTVNTPVPPGPPGPPSPPGPPVIVMTTDFSSFAFTPNQLAAANLLDAVQLVPRAGNLISFLNTEPFADLPADFQKISPEGLTAFYEISFSNANIQKLNLESRLDDIHNGSNGFSSNMKINGATVNLEDRADADGKSSKAVVEPILQHAPENRWGVWMTGFGDFVDVNGDGNAQGYNFTTGGVSLGLDYRITDQLAIGVMGEYSHTWTSLNPNGHIDVDSGRGGVYATWFSHGFYLNGAIYGGHNNYDSGRAGLGGLANGGTEGAEWSTFIGGGYDFHFGPLTVGPIASLQYTDVGIDSFSEKGSLAPLAIHSGSAESLRSDVGFRAFYQWQIGKIILEPSLKAAWEHEYKYSALPITAGFAGVPGPSATFFGSSEGHDSAVISAGLSAQLTPAVTAYVNYDGQLGRDNYDSNAVTGGVKISF